MSWDNTTITEAAGFISEIWSLDVLEAVMANLVMGGLVWDFSKVASSQPGDTINVPSVGNFVAKDKTANAKVQPQADTASKIPIIINKHKEVSFVIEDVVKVQSNQDLRTIYTKQAGKAIAKIIDTDLVSLYAGLSQTKDGGTAIGYDDVKYCEKKLNLAEAPLEDRFLVVDSNTLDDMLSEDKFINQDFIKNAKAIINALSGGKTPVESGFVGDVLGFKTFFSNNLVTTTSSGVDTIHNLAFHRQAFAKAIQMGPRVQVSYVQEYLGFLVTVDVLYGVKEMVDAYAVDLQRKSA